MEVDSNLLAQYPAFQFAWVDVSVDRPDVRPVRLIFSIMNALQAITLSSPGALAGTSGRIFLSGMMLNRSDLVSSGLLRVTGATVRQATYVADNRFAGNVFMVRLDVDGASLTMKTLPAKRLSAT